MNPCRTSPTPTNSAAVTESAGFARNVGRWTSILATLVALVLLVAACSSGPGGASDSSADRTDGSEPVVSAPESTDDQAVPDTGGRLDQARAELESTRAELARVTAERDKLRTKLDEVSDRMKEFSTRAYSAETQVSALEVEVDELRQKYDPEIRAETQAEVDAEINRACQEAVTDIDTDIAQIVHFDADWAFLTTKDEIVAAVTECAAPERSKTAEQREAERLAACETVSPDALEKNPDKYEGSCVHLFAYIVQFDSNTGPCSFHAEISDRRSRRWYDYDIRSAFGLEDSELLSATRTDCPELDGIDGDDFVEIWATGLGSFSYDTTLGGSNTVPSFRIEKIQLVAKN